jgi:folate-binding protein YgfZ
MNTARPLSADSSTATLPWNGVAPLPHLGVIQIEGEDAAKFIHGQLTQDFSLLGQDKARLAAFCSAKGRMQASFVGFKRPGGQILLVCSRDLLASTLKRLSMFVLRAKARLTDASEEFAVYGLAGNAIQTIAGSADSAWAKADFDQASVVNLYPADGVARQLWVGPRSLGGPPGAPLSDELWQWSDVRSGVVTLNSAVVDAFVPQMLNFESIGGVNFKKGCYPGQEVVARSQFRGTLKRRAFVVHSDTALRAGDEIYGAEVDSQPVGTVAQAAKAQSGFEAIVSAQISAVDAGPLHVGGPSGTQLTVLPLPYPLLEDV